MVNKNNDIQIYRKRFIPDEMIHLKDDQVLSCDADLLVTKWDTLKPRCDIAGGISAYFISKNIKVSKIHDCNQQLVYWYCDIINTIYDPTTYTYIFEDLLIDIIVYENGLVKVVDLDEVAEILDKQSLNTHLLATALRTTNSLLQDIYQDKFDEYKKVINTYC